MKAAVLGATGLMGQRFVQLLNHHPWFTLESVTGSERSVGETFGEAVRWRVETPLKEDFAELEVQPSNPKFVDNVDVVFSALPSEVARTVEEEFAKAGHVVVSNASAYRMEPDVPLLNPEVNCEHSSLIDEQRRRRNWDGAIVTNPNCTTAILTLSLKPVLDGFGVERVIVSSMQAASGAGYPGVASLDLIDNVIPFIREEEEKVERESAKILGQVDSPAKFGFSASCHRVPVLDGHMEAVFVETKEQATPDKIVSVMENFSAEPQRLKLPSAPNQPVVVKREEDRPQPRFDRLEGNGMSVVVGRVRKDRSNGGIKYIALGHNTIRGGAGCAILIAEYLRSKGYVG